MNKLIFLSWVTIFKIIIYEVLARCRLSRYCFNIRKKELINQKIQLPWELSPRRWAFMLRLRPMGSGQHKLFLFIKNRPAAAGDSLHVGDRRTSLLPFAGEKLLCSFGWRSGGHGLREVWELIFHLCGVSFFLFSFACFGWIWFWMDWGLQARRSCRRW